MAQKKEKKQKKIQKEVKKLRNKPSKTDPFGSYTGKPEEKYDVPVQDADDL